MKLQVFFIIYYSKEEFDKYDFKILNNNNYSIFFREFFYLQLF